MTKEKGIGILKHGLLGFVLVTIGFAIGKEVTLRRVQVTTAQAGRATVGGDTVVVTYAHASIRCVSCETIERLIHETLNEQFAQAVATGRLVFKDVDFQEDTTFARRYEIVANTVIVSRPNPNDEPEYQRLDKIWELYEDPPAFKKYLGDAIRTALNPVPGGDA
jgi:hypothetical protein